MQAPDMLELIAAVAVVSWSLHRGRYMTAATRTTDRLALVMIGTGAMCYALQGLHLLFGLFGYSWIDDAKAALLMPGIALWLGMPPLRKWRELHRPQRAVSEP